MTNKADSFFGVGIVVLSVLVYKEASKFPTVAAGLGAGGFPKFIAVCLGILGALLAVQSYLAFRKNAGQDKAVFTKADFVGAFSLVVSFYMYIMLVKPLGYMVATMLFFFLFMGIYGERKWLSMAVISVCFSIITYYLFKQVFYIMLPQGKIF